jgi:D-inositol-3-phosphate glycosyltransferase
VFHGAASDADLRELYQRSRLFLHGSVDEPFGMAPLEAIACGTPVVAHRSGGPAEFVTAECGRLVDSLEVRTGPGRLSPISTVLDGRSGIRSGCGSVPVASIGR